MMVYRVCVCTLGIWHGRECSNTVVLCVGRLIWKRMHRRKYCGIGVIIEAKWGFMKEVWYSDVRMAEWC